MKKTYFSPINVKNKNDLFINFVPDLSHVDLRRKYGNSHQWKYIYIYIYFVPYR